MISLATKKLEVQLSSLESALFLDCLIVRIQIFVTPVGQLISARWAELGNIRKVNKLFGEILCKILQFEDINTLKLLHKTMLVLFVLNKL